VILVVDAFYLVGWQGLAMTLSYVWIVAKRLTRRGNMVARAYDPEAWIEGPRGRVALDSRGWPMGTEKWAE
jgi:hypothetical protein